MDKFGTIHSRCAQNYTITLDAKVCLTAHSHQKVLLNPDWAIKYNILVGLQTPKGVKIAHTSTWPPLFLVAAPLHSPSRLSSDPTFSGPRCSWYTSATLLSAYIPCTRYLTLLLAYIQVQTGQLPSSLLSPSTPRAAQAWAWKCRRVKIKGNGGGKNLHLYHNQAKCHPTAGVFDR